MSWASEADVLAITGTVATDAEIVLAQGVIDLFSGVTEDVEDLHSRDERLLRSAVAYQTVWMVPQVDVLTRTAVTDIKQDGVEVTPSEPSDLILAPLAKLALSQLSWTRRNRSRTVARDRRTYSTHEAWAAAWLRDDAADIGWRLL